jgi:hypothetical protein
VVGDAIGLDSRDASRDYLHRDRGARDRLAQSLHRIQRTASVVLTAIDAGG